MPRTFSRAMYVLKGKDGEEFVVILDANDLRYTNWERISGKVVDKSSVPNTTWENYTHRVVLHDVAHDEDWTYLVAYKGETE